METRARVKRRVLELNLGRPTLLNSTDTVTLWDIRACLGQTSNSTCAESNA